LASLAVPLVQAPMAGVSGGALAGAVSAAGGLGFIGVDSSAPGSWVADQAAVAAGAGRPFGIGLMAWSLGEHLDQLEAVLAARPSLVSVSFGPYADHVAALRAQGITTATQACTVADAHEALAAGVDLLVVRGGEGGGHGRDEVATLPLLQQVLDLVQAEGVDVPVLAAGGISSARGLAAALAAGADGVWVGTAFMLCTEATTAPEARQRLAAARAEDTRYSAAFDRSQRMGWPREFAGRHLRSPFSDLWPGTAEGADTDDDAFAAVAAAKAAGAGDALPIYAGQGVGALTRERPAADVVADFAAARDLVRQAAQRWATSTDS
jgi:nitronate monooxygenase